jgi:arylsulfatase A-like enzyme
MRRLAGLFLAAAAALASVPAGACRGRAAAPGANGRLLLGDTVRRDAVGAYGAGPGATPAIDALARSGARFDDARAQSSWTLPSVASLFTSRWPHEVTDWADMPQRLPDDAVTLAELFAARGDVTAGFSANVLVNRDDGFAQGFRTFWAPPAEASMWTDALTTAGHAAAWLKENQRRGPFFAYVHFVDPHSPYCPPGRRPNDPAAPVPGDASRAFYGKDPLPDAAKLAEWRRLYAEEVALVDRGVAAVLAALDPDVRRKTTVVFLADHGEEFFEHGFLGHGWSLYDELLRVPLVVAGPGIPAGRVVREPVGLIDLLPTLAARARLRPDAAVAAGFRGIDLSPAFAGRPLPRGRTFLAETYRFGPMRLAVLRDGKKAVFFNKGPGESPPPTDRLFGEARVRALLPREALFDLARDPLEKTNLAATREALPVLAAAREVVWRSLRDALPGRWVAVRGRGAGGRIEGTVRYAGSPVRLVPLFPRDGETFALSGADARVSLWDDGSVRAWLVPDRLDLAVASADLTSGGGKLLPTAVADPLAPGWASWVAAGKRHAGAPIDVSEQVRRLRALGYLQ